MLTAVEHTAIAVARADRTAAYLRGNVDLLSRYGINVENAIERIAAVAASGVRAYVALDPIMALSDRIVRISDQINGTVVRRGGRNILTRSGPDDNLDGDLLAAIGVNLCTAIPGDSELYCPPARGILRSV